MTTTLSARQYPLLKMFITKGENVFMSLQEAATLDQRPFRSLLMRGWIKYEPKYGFTITWEGREAWRVFSHTSIVRVDPTGPMCAVFYRMAKMDPPPSKTQAKPKAPSSRRPGRPSRQPLQGMRA